MKKIIIIAFIIIVIAGLAYIIYGNLRKDVQNQEGPTVRLSVLKGPTGIGSVKLIEENEQGNTKNKYEVTMARMPDEIVSKVSTGEVDIAVVSSNLAANLYQKTNGEIQTIAINTSGILYLLDSTSQIKTIEDLRGKEIYATGQGAVPEFALQFVLEANGLEIGKDVTVIFLKEHAELTTMAAAGSAPICMLPEPFVSTLLTKSDSFQIALDLTEEWEKAVQKEYKEEVTLVMSTYIARKDWLLNNQEAFQNFIEDYQMSTEYVRENVEEAAKLVVKHEIIENEEIVKKAIPNCNIIFITGSSMKDNLTRFYEILFELEPKSIGGALPNEDFYYER